MENDINQIKSQENVQKEQINYPELIETYDFFGNSIKANITLYNGMKIIIEKLVSIEEKLDKLNGNKN